MADNNKHQISGTIEDVLEPVVISDKFTKHEFIVRTDEAYPQSLCFQATGEGFIQFLRTRVKSGMPVTVHFNIAGKENNGRYFTTLKAWKIEL